MKGIITQIVRNSDVDGPGLRTVVFLKGCPLRCGWCHNPETQAAGPEIFFDIRRCMDCGLCAEACHENAIVDKDKGRLDRKRCTLCMACVEACPTTALERTGTEVDASQLMKEIYKDSILYKNSGGGVTFSGGEPLMQCDFLLAMLRGCKEKGISTAVDTCGAMPWKKFEMIIRHADLFLYDIKHASRVDVLCELAMQNARRLSDYGSRLWLRIPIIPGFNADEQDINDIGAFIRSLKRPPERISLLPFHRFPENKYQMLGRSKEFTAAEELSDDEISHFQGLLSDSSGRQVAIGG